jgi:enoyl-CoA hydratase/carnithine racemase
MGVRLKGAEAERNGPVGIVKIHPVERMMERSLESDCDEFIEVHMAIALALDELRWDPEIRVVIVTGSQEDVFYSAPTAAHYEVEKNRARLTKPRNESRPSEARAKFHPVPGYVDQLLHYEKPVLARVNGDVIGAGQSVMWGCDFIIAREDAVFADVHTGMGEVVNRHGERIGFPWAVNPGDGASAFAQMNFSSYRYKEYQMLSQCLTARELADMHVINYAVPAKELDDKVDEFVARLLARPQFALERARKLLQKPIIAQANLQHDLSWAYEQADFRDHAAAGHFAPDWRPTLSPDVELPAKAVGKPAVGYHEWPGPAAHR